MTSGLILKTYMKIRKSGLSNPKLAGESENNIKNAKFIFSGEILQIYVKFDFSKKLEFAQHW